MIWFLLGLTWAIGLLGAWLIIRKFRQHSLSLRQANDLSAQMFEEMTQPGTTLGREKPVTPWRGRKSWHDEDYVQFLKDGVAL